MRVSEIDTPALLIDREIVLRNLQKMQNYADAAGVSLRPHTKTHKMPYFAKLQKASALRASRSPKRARPRSWRQTG